MRRSDHPLYKSWHAFMYGCTNTNSYHWHQYGALGIKMHAPWCPYKVGFDRFIDWVDANLGPKPSPDAIIRRKNSKKGFRPGNLEWSDRLYMSTHRRSNHYLTYKGRKQTISEWSRELDIKAATIWARVHDRGYTVKQALEK